MCFYQINQKQPDGYYHIPRIGNYAYKTKDVRDPKIKEIIDEIKKKQVTKLQVFWKLGVLLIEIRKEIMLMYRRSLL